MSKSPIKIGDDVYFIIREYSPPGVLKFNIPHICIGQVRRIYYYYDSERIKSVLLSITINNSLIQLPLRRIYLTFAEAKKEIIKISNLALTKNIDQLKKLEELNSYLLNIVNNCQNVTLLDIIGESQKSHTVAPQKLFKIIKSNRKLKLIKDNLIMMYNNNYYYAIDKNHYQLKPDLDFNNLKPYVEELVND